MMAGDFNEIVHISEKLGGRVRPEWQMRGFRNALEYATLLDLGYSGPIFTWSDHESHVRLDRA